MRKYNLNIISKEPMPLNKKNKWKVANVSGNNLSLYFSRKYILKLGGLLSFIYSSIFLIALHEDNEHIEYWIIGGFFAILGIILLSIGFLLPTRKWTLDRMSQKITIPHLLLYKHYSFNIHDVKTSYLKIDQNILTFIPLAIPLLWYRIKSSFFYFSVLTIWRSKKGLEIEPDRIWSFYLWFLDRNRPLPPGELLNPFREEDFQRRKAEGFPPPLICSCIPTPEATIEQQIEREKYWKDDNYIFRLDRRRDSNIWGSSSENSFIPLEVEKGAQIVIEVDNPNNWKKSPYPEIPNFTYLPTAFAMRYEYENSSIYYAYIDAKTREVYSPPKGTVYKQEIVR